MVSVCPLPRSHLGLPAFLILGFAPRRDGLPPRPLAWSIPSTLSPGSFERRFLPRGVWRCWRLSLHTPHAEVTGNTRSRLSSAVPFGARGSSLGSSVAVSYAAPFGYVPFGHSVSLGGVFRCSELDTSPPRGSWYGMSGGLPNYIYECISFADAPLAQLRPRPTPSHRGDETRWPTRPSRHR